jgi:polysaccharide export outer membrane protein
MIRDDVELVQITPELVATNRVTASAAIPAELQNYRPESYQISPGDTLIVTVWDHPELTTPAGSQQQTLVNGRLVYPDGTLFYPYAGSIKVSGMTIEELRRVLTSKLGRYIQNPQIDVNVVGYGGRVSLQGAFANTAPQSITTVPLTLSQAVGAGAIDVDNADISGLTLTRDGKVYRIDLDALSRNVTGSPDIYLKPGDHLHLPFNDRKEAYVLGEVVRPQAITFRTTDMTLTQALGRAGGLNPVSAKGQAVYVIRGIEEMEQHPARVYHLDAKSPVSFTLADRFSVKPGDVVFVGPAGITRWSRYLSQLLPLSGILNNAANVQNDL